MTPDQAWTVGILLLLLYEAYAISNTIPGDTLSESVWKASRRPIVPFLAGLLAGHFFWNRICS